MPSQQNMLCQVLHSSYVQLLQIMVLSLRPRSFLLQKGLEKKGRIPPSLKCNLRIRQEEFSILPPVGVKFSIPSLWSRRGFL